jgi:putative FmdB family regulatory protein
MPLYEYQCDACGHRFEAIRKFSDGPLEICPKCGGHIQKLVSAPAFQLKGTGWYATDFAGKKPEEGKRQKEEGKSEGTESKSEKVEGKSTEGKGEKAESKSEAGSGKVESKNDTAPAKTESAPAAPAKD